MNALSLRITAPDAPPPITFVVEGIAVRKPVARRASLLAVSRLAARTPAKGKPRKVPSSLRGFNFSEGKSLRGPRLDRVRLKARFFGERRQQIANAIALNPLCDAAIALAFRASCPAAIFGSVIPVIVYPVNHMARRAWPHIRYEGREISLPLRADGYSPPSIISELLEVGVIAAAQHSLPYRVKRVRVFEGHGRSPLIASLARKGTGKQNAP